MMFREKIKKLRDEIKYCFFSGSKQTKQSRLAIAAEARDTISGFLGSPHHEAISLGQNCTSAWYLKQVEVKKHSYPFDWLISSSDTLASCLNDNFASFMDKSQMFSFDNEKRAGHKIYHPQLFNHRNPLVNPEDYAYYQRCISRFNNILDSGAAAVFICTLFQNEMSDYQKCCQLMLARNPNIKFIFIEQQLKGEFALFQKAVNQNTLLLHFTSEDMNRGKRYRNQLDDRVIKLVFSAFKQ